MQFTGDNMRWRSHDRYACASNIISPTLSRREETASARLAQPAERKALNLVVVGSSPTVGALQMWDAMLGTEERVGAPLLRMLCLYFHCVCFPEGWRATITKRPRIRGSASPYAGLAPTAKKAERSVPLRHAAVLQRICSHFEPCADDRLRQHWQRAIL